MCGVLDKLCVCVCLSQWREKRTVFPRWKRAFLLTPVVKYMQCYDTISSAVDVYVCIASLSLQCHFDLIPSVWHDNEISHGPSTLHTHTRAEEFTHNMIWFVDPRILRHRDMLWGPMSRSIKVSFKSGCFFLDVAFWVPETLQMCCVLCSVSVFHWFLVYIER